MLLDSDGSGAEAHDKLVKAFVVVLPGEQSGSVDAWQSGRVERADLPSNLFTEDYFVKVVAKLTEGCLAVLLPIAYLGWSHLEAGI